MSKHNVKFEQFFAAPRAQVFAWFADHQNFGRVFGGKFSRIKDGKDPNDPNGLGSIREIRGQGFKFEETIVKYQPPSVIEYTVSKGGPIKNHLGRLSFSDEPGGTKLVYTIGFEPKVPLTGGIIASVLCAAWHRGVHRAVKGIATAA